MLGRVVSGSRTWMCTIAAPALAASTADCAICAGVTGPAGFLPGLSADPLTAHEIITLRCIVAPNLLLQTTDEPGTRPPGPSERSAIHGGFPAGRSCCRSRRGTVSSTFNVIKRNWKHPSQYSGYYSLVPPRRIAEGLRRAAGSAGISPALAGAGAGGDGWRGENVPYCD